MFLEACEETIERCQSLAELDALGHEIADVKSQVGAKTQDMEQVKRLYLSKRKKLA
jgi:hypothetical protein